MASRQVIGILDVVHVAYVSVRSFQVEYEPQNLLPSKSIIIAWSDIQILKKLKSLPSYVEMHCLSFLILMMSNESWKVPSLSVGGSTFSIFPLLLPLLSTLSVRHLLPICQTLVRLMYMSHVSKNISYRFQILR